MDINEKNESFWNTLELLLETNKIIIDRPKGSKHPKFQDLIYPVDYGFIENTKAMDNNCIDLFRGSKSPFIINGIICTIDKLKKDSEIKILINCTEDEIKKIYKICNSEFMKGIFIPK